MAILYLLFKDLGLLWKLLYYNERKSNLKNFRCVWPFCFLYCIIKSSKKYFKIDHIYHIKVGSDLINIKSNILIQEKKFISIKKEEMLLNWSFIRAISEVIIRTAWCELTLSEIIGWVLEDLLLRFFCTDIVSCVGLFVIISVISGIIRFDWSRMLKERR